MRRVARALARAWDNDILAAACVAAVALAFVLSLFAYRR